jgi:predicted permease
MFALVAIITLALGIGANTAVFSVMNAVVLRYLPVHDPQQLVLLHYTEQPSNAGQTGYDDTSLPENAFEALRSQSNVFQDLVAFVPLNIDKLPVRYGSDPEEAFGDEVSGNFFSGLGVQMARGHGFTLDDERQHTQIGVLSYSYWTRRFARNPSVLNQTLYVKGVPFTVVGVAAPEFVGVERSKVTDFWVPLQANPNLKPWGHSPQDSYSLPYGNPKWFYLMQIGRLRPGVSLARAQAQLNPIYQNTIFSALGKPKDGEKSTELHLTPVRGIEGQDVKPLAILMAMVALVLLIACGNVAMLLVARNASRQREFSLRMALGARTGGMLRQLMAESLILVVAGAALGWLFAHVGTRALGAWSEIEVSLAPDNRVLLFTLAICIVAAVAFSLAPLRNAMRVPAGLALKTSAAASSSTRTRMRAGHAVVALQISLCLMLLAGSGLLVRTLRNLENADLGLNASGLVVFGTTPPQQPVHESASKPDPNIDRFAAPTPEDLAAIRFYSKLLDRLRTLPGVESVTLMSNRLGSGWSNNTGVRLDGATPGGKQFAQVRWNAVGADYFHVLQVPLLLGRDITDADSVTSPRVAIVNQTFVTRYVQGGNAIGHHIQIFGVKSPEYTIVGVAADSRYTEVRENARPMAYLPYAQVPSIGTMHIELRAARAPEAVLSDVRRVVRDFGADVPVLQPTSQREQFAETFSSERLFARLSIFFGVLAALLVITGLYASLAYRVSRRTAEIGVRMAIGARPGQVLWMVLRESLLICAIGALIGVPAALACSSLLRTMLFGLSASDPVSFTMALAGVVVIAVVASAVPALRASAVDPMVALRCE